MRLKRRQPGFFDIEERTKKLTQLGDPLIAPNAHVDWEAFRADLNPVHLGVGVHGGEWKGNAGTKPIDVVLKFKILVLQQLHNLSDDRIEYPIRDRLSFMRFLGLQLEDRVPDAKTVWVQRQACRIISRADQSRGPDGATVCPLSRAVSRTGLCGQGRTND